MNNQLISIDEYKRIFETIYSILKFTGLEPEKNCVYFSLIGAVLLHEHFEIECKSYSGAAAYYLNKEINAVLSFAENVGDNNYIGSINGFHSWNENKEFVIDFQAPLFAEMGKNTFGGNICHKKMFQRKIEDHCNSPLDFKNEGDFFHAPNPELSQQITDRFVEDPLNMDLVNICNNWFVNPISNMETSCEIKNEVGQKKEIRLTKIELAGAW